MTPRSVRQGRPARIALGGLVAVTAAVLTVLVAATGGSARTQAAPTIISEPTISGSAVVGQTLTANNGVWSGTGITFTYQWVRCNASDAACQVLAGATAKTYAVQGADVGFRLRAQVTATNSDGANSAIANGTPVVTVSQTGSPQNVQPPTISGTPATFQTLTASTGLWSGVQPISYPFQWLRCDASGNNCLDVVGQTGETYGPQTADVDRTLRVRVQATNNQGSRSVTSAQTQKVAKGQTPLPAGAIALPSGGNSIPVTSVSADQRLVIDSVTFSPRPVRSRTSPITVRIRVRDTRGYSCGRRSCSSAPRRSSRRRPATTGRPHRTAGSPTGDARGGLPATAERLRGAVLRQGVAQGRSGARRSGRHTARAGAARSAVGNRVRLKPDPTRTTPRGQASA